MPRVRRNRAPKARRRNSSRAMKPFSSTLTQLPLKLPNSGVNTIQFSPAILCPDLQVANQFRQFKLISVLARFYPHPLSTEGSSQVSVQLLMADLATNTQVPATPIIPLSLTNTTRLRCRAVGARWITSNSGSGENIFAINVLSTLPNQTILVDLQSNYLLSRDGMAPPPAALFSELEQPESPVYLQPPSLSSNSSVVTKLKRLHH